MLVVIDGYDKILEPKLLKVVHEAENEYSSGEYQLPNSENEHTIQVLVIRWKRRYQG